MLAAAYLVARKDPRHLPPRWLQMTAVLLAASLVASGRAHGLLGRSAGMHCLRLRPSPAALGHRNRQSAYCERGRRHAAGA